MKFLRAFIEILGLIPLLCLLVVSIIFTVCLAILAMCLYIISFFLIFCCIGIGSCLFLLFVLVSLVELPFSLLFKKPIYFCQFGKWLFDYCDSSISGVVNCLDEKGVFEPFDYVEDFCEFAFDAVSDMIFRLDEWGGVGDTISDVFVWLNEVCEGTHNLKSANGKE